MVKRSRMYFLITLFFIACFLRNFKGDKVELEFLTRKRDETVKVGSSLTVQISLTSPLNESLNVSVGGINAEDSIKIKPPFFVLQTGEKNTSVTIETLKVHASFPVDTTKCIYDGDKNCSTSNIGRCKECVKHKLRLLASLILVLVCAVSLSQYILYGYVLTNAFIRLKIVHNLALETVIDIVGWIYFFAWSFSFYPQIYLNWRRKSVVGLNFDFLALNLAGFACYSLYNIALFSTPAVQHEYFVSRGPRSRIPVRSNDVAFSVHAMFATIVTIAQCTVYTRAGQRVSHVCWAFLSIFSAFFTTILIITLSSQLLNWYEFVSYVSYIKIAITLIKYIPQAYYNYRRKSTVGWSIGNIFLDFTGGSFSVLQMTLQSYNIGDWSEYFGDPTKFALGLISMVFDVIFMVQHYILYRNRAVYKVMPEPEDNESQAQEAHRDE